jgi:subtilisin family serine protease
MGGGIAAVIYNNQKDGFSGSLALFTNVTIPAVAISGNSGKVILDSFLGYTATLTGTDGYAYYDGTSMAAPHISG